LNEQSNIAVRPTDIYIFNPQNDLALADGGVNYVAPPFAMQLAHDMAVLPAFIAPAGALLITDSAADAQWLEHLDSTFDMHVSAIERKRLRHVGNGRIMPWGWSLDLRRRLIKWGLDPAMLPSAKQVEVMRQLSHRRTSIILHKRLQQLLGTSLCPAPVELATLNQVVNFVTQHHDCYIKTPWSSSGRGIYHATAGASSELMQWCSGAIKRQGSVLCEVALSNIQDFAVEFFSQGGKVALQGYSVFSTDSHSQYRSGMVASSHVLNQQISQRYSHFNEVVEALSQALNDIVAPHYTGWLGVDMLLYNTTQGVISINPCVELNLRPTMGAVTCMLGNSLLAEGTTGTFSFEQRLNSNQPWTSPSNAVVDGGRLSHGNLCLTTPSPTALYRAILTVND